MRTFLFTKKRVWLFLAIITLFSQKVSADEITWIEPDLTGSTEYSIIGTGYTYYKVTVEKAGKLSVKVTTFNGNATPTIYTDEEMQSKYKNSFSGYTTTDRTYTCSLDEAGTYYIEVGGFGLSSTYEHHITFTFESKEDLVLSLTSISPTPGESFDLQYNGDGQIILAFNKTAIVSGSSTLACGNKSTTIEAVGSNNLIFVVGDTIYNWMEEGSIKSGDTFTLTINKLVMKSNNSVTLTDLGEYANTESVSLYETALIIKYLVPAKATYIIEQPESFTLKSYVAPGSEEGLYTIKFSAPLDTTENQTAFANLGMGNPTSTDYYLEESCPISVKDSSLTVDLAGKIRTYSTMGLTGAYTSFTLMVSEVLDSNGNKTYTGNAGSYTHNFTLNYEIVSCNVTALFDPQDGSDLNTGQDSIEIWLSEDAIASYDGIQFVFTNENNEKDTVIVSDVTVTKEEQNSITYTVSIPENVKNGKNVIVSFANAILVDGSDCEISAKYNKYIAADFLPTSVSPDAVLGGETATILPSLSTIRITFDDTMSLTDSAKVTITNIDSGTVTVITPTISRKILVINTPNLVNGCTYLIEVAQGSVINSDNMMYNPTLSYLYTINEEVTIYDGYEISPASGSTLTSLDTFTLTCTSSSYLNIEYYKYPTLYKATDEGNVLIDSLNTNSMAYLDENTDNVVVITLTQKITEPGKYYLNIPDSCFTIGLDGSVYVDTMSFVYTVEKEEIVPSLLPESPEVIKSEDYDYYESEEITLSSFSGETITFASDVEITSVDESLIKVYCVDDDGRSTLNFTATAKNNVLTITTEKCTDPAYYTIYVAEGAVVAGAKSNYAFYLYYTVTQNTIDETVVSYPDNTVSQDSLHYILLEWTNLTFDNDDDAIVPLDVNGETPVYASLKSGEEVITQGTLTDTDPRTGDWVENNQVLVVLDSVVYAETSTTYTLVIPEKAMYYGDPQNGIYNSEITIEFIVSTPTGIGDAKVALASDDKVYTLSGLRVESKSLKSGVYIVNGKKFLVK